MTNQNTQVASPRASAVAAKKDIRDVIQAQKDEIAKALPRHMNPDRMIRVMLTAINTTPKLLGCTKESLLAALMKCSQYGLEPDGRHAHLIPYKEECQLIFDYKGLVCLTRRSGDVLDIHCDVVYEKDHFEFGFGTGGGLVHRPNLKDKDRGEITCAYSFVKLKDNSTSYEVMPWWEIEAVKENSQGFKAFKAGKIPTNPWDTNWSEMAKKTVFRRHSKWLPLSFEVSEALHGDDDNVSSEERRFAQAKAVSASTGLLETPSPLSLPQSEETVQVNFQQPEAEPVPVQSDPPKDRAANEAPSPVSQLIEFVVSQGFTADDLFFWAKSGGHIDNAKITADQFPVEVAQRLLRAKQGMIKGLNQFRSEVVK